MRFQIPEILRFFLNDLQWKVKTNRKEIFLTFDDGPHPQITLQTLDLLDKYGAKATFFCVGENVQRFSGTFEEIKRRGHSVGNHTFNHIKGFGFPVQDYVENVKKADSLIKSKLFRPPHGQITPKLIRALKNEFKIIMWDFITFDYDTKISPDEILNIVEKKTKKGAIVVFHDSEKAGKNMLEALPQALEYWKENGYEICSLIS